MRSNVIDTLKNSLVRHAKEQTLPSKASSTTSRRRRYLAGSDMPRLHECSPRTAVDAAVRSGGLQGTGSTGLSRSWYPVISCPILSAASDQSAKTKMACSKIVHTNAWHARLVKITRTSPHIMLILSYAIWFLFRDAELYFSTSQSHGHRSASVPFSFRFASATRYLPDYDPITLPSAAMVGHVSLSSTHEWTPRTAKSPHKQMASCWTRKCKFAWE